MANDTDFRSAPVHEANRRTIYANLSIIVDHREDTRLATVVPCGMMLIRPMRMPTCVSCARLCVMKRLLNGGQDACC
jgi:hypothetical protein